MEAQENEEGKNPELVWLGCFIVFAVFAVSSSLLRAIWPSTFEKIQVFLGGMVLVLYISCFTVACKKNKGHLLLNIFMVVLSALLAGAIGLIIDVVVAA